MIRDPQFRMDTGLQSALIISHGAGSLHKVNNSSIVKDWESCAIPPYQELLKNWDPYSLKMDSVYNLQSRKANRPY
jgi:hypothetical protein